METNNSRSAAFLTYNSVGRAGTYVNGWMARNGNRAFIGQHPRNIAWGAGGNPVELLIGSITGNVSRISIMEGRREGILGAFQELTDQFARLDYLVVYVGAGGSELAIELAAQFPTAETVFVLCDCGIERKRELIRRASITAYREVICECGGHGAMQELVEKFLSTGTL